MNLMCNFAVLDGLKYAPSHEWVKHDGPVATIGITDHAQVILHSFFLLIFSTVSICL